MNHSTGWIRHGEWETLPSGVAVICPPGQTQEKLWFITTEGPSTINTKRYSDYEFSSQFNLCVKLWNSCQPVRLWIWLYCNLAPFSIIKHHLLLSLKNCQPSLCKTWPIMSLAVGSIWWSANPAFKCSMPGRVVLLKTTKCPWKTIGCLCPASSER